MVSVWVCRQCFILKYKYLCNDYDTALNWRLLALLRLTLLVKRHFKFHLYLFKGCVSLDPSKISKSGWWGLQLDTWQLCNSLWYSLINSKLHINNKNVFFISHNIWRCHTFNVLNHPADLSGIDLTSDPSWFTHSPGKSSTKIYSPQIFKGSLLFSLSTANKMKQILCVICFDTKWLSVLFKTVIFESDDHNVPHYAYKTTAHV